MTKAFLLAIAIGTAVAAPASAASALYRCALNLEIVADYASDGKSVTVYTQGKTFRLPIAMSGSGARYSDGTTTIWEHQATATFETTGVALQNCKAVLLSH
ncbi:MAG: MliC family protein [Alphaproteobacteria bacterium]|nr:MliC family protein [Alphaproteobacteria bacterium]